MSVRHTPHLSEYAPVVRHPFSVRIATVADAAVIARHRAEMFRDMGQLPVALYEDLVERTIVYLRDALARGEYVGWLASPDGQPESIVGGAGMQRRRILPRPLAHAGESRIVHGNEILVLNVFTEKPWRRRGVAELLMRRVLEWACTEEIDTVVLHPSDEGRALYERLGFVQTNEMRYSKPLRFST
jgi:GNAT superfamily N-acetyltransferase